MKCLLILLKSNLVITTFVLILIILSLVLEPKEERTRTERDKAPAVFAVPQLESVQKQYIVCVFFNDLLIV